MSTDNQLICYAEGVPHEAHTWDFGSGEAFWCPGSSTEEVGCTDECPDDCEADHEGER